MFAVALGVIGTVFPDGFLKNRIIGALTDACPGSSVTIGRLQVHILYNRLVADSVRVVTADPAFLCSGAGRV